ncbi:cellulose synthase/poly-beta-1,6-N-acetylglucosamine synthase-like glycosyltransferase [Algoriphagus sp. 4150]|uniref:glycosyltransferase n=1 Tax=Algoriphagus sp. 4150 TaxID=2817756 RepID=UPI00285CF1A3|nr:glycosyltransferase [Algoriphagus sp. 4150]MDR7130327.1 cellulose synthase/poly-beta-1,6-N-acetylglucosamine synthase-like glycosyltransferase [Algoriphagus sp. 4150]
MIFWFCIGIVGLILIQFVVAILRIKFFWKNHKHDLSSDLPAVSILVAARNEEKDICNLLKSFELLDYPSERMQFLFADDQSTDRTAEILKDWCGEGVNRILISITSSESGIFNKNGKANALAILGEKATGNYYFFTDADCEVNPGWVSEGVDAFIGNVGLVIGITQVKANQLMERFQEIDWWLTLGFVKVATDLGVHTTGLGNNMVISREAYEQSGGFKNIPFCLTEDLEISRSIQREGFTIAHKVSMGMLASTKPEANFSDLLDQRKRWMSGVMTLPFYWKLILGLQAVYFVGLIGLIVLSPAIGLLLGLIKMLLQGMFLRLFSRKAGMKINGLSLLLFDFYNLHTTVLTILYYFWPSNTKWKSRIYP